MDSTQKAPRRLTREERDDLARREVERDRHLIRGTDHDEALLTHRALTAYAAMLREVDRAFPDPEQRALADAADKLAARVRDINQARDYYLSVTGDA